MTLSHLKILCAAALLSILYYGVLTGLWTEWMTRPAASHGVLIPPVVAYLTWLRRRAIEASPVQPDGRGLFLVVAGCLMYLTGILGAELFLTRTSLIVLLAGLIFWFWGWQRLQTLAFPLLLLATMIPMPGLVFNSLAGPLQNLASYVATELVQTLGVSAYREGNVIQLAGITLGVAEACSGLQTLSTLIVASLLLGPIYPCPRPLRILLVLTSIPLAVGINIVRVAGTALLADFRPELARGFYHSFSGWVVFLGGFFILLIVARFLQYASQTTRLAPAVTGLTRSNPPART